MAIVLLELDGPDGKKLIVQRESAPPSVDQTPQEYVDADPSLPDWECVLAEVVETESSE